METLNYTEIVTGRGGFTNPRGVLGADGIKLLADDIEARGVLQNLVVWRTEVEGKVLNVLLDGHRRYEAICLLASEDRLENPNVPVKVEEGSLLDAKMIAVATHVHHEALSTFDTARALADLVSSGATQKELATKLRKSQPWISRVMGAYNKANAALKAAWQDCDIPLDTVMDISALPEDEQKAAVAEQKSLRASGKRKDYGKARLKGKRNDIQRMPGKLITKMIMMGDGAPEKARYVRGFTDALKVTQGTLGIGELSHEWMEFVSSKNDTVTEE